MQRVHVNRTDPETEIFGDVVLEDKLREWASFRGQTLSRTGILTMLGCNACLLAFAFLMVVHLLVQLNTKLERWYIYPSDHVKVYGLHFVCWLCFNCKLACELLGALDCQCWTETSRHEQL